MQPNMTHSFLVVLLALACGLLPALADAQGSATPTPQQMIEQLQAPAAATAGPRTRSLRNITVESSATSPAGAPPASGAAAPSEAATARPSLSLLIQFDFNSSKVRPESQQALANLALALQSRELEASRFAIEGHTDAKGRAEYNLHLSQQRADAVREFLASRGVATARLAPVGKGATELANQADPLAAENRRVRIVNLD
jgi:outer membrane protein OmpA-like peptidoglycan-associated protein